MSFINEVISWYNKNKRELPWRDTEDPYLIWLSEIILQQTRVEQGLPYFQRFSEKYPDVSRFADASESEILHLWQGLGYYSRGRNMHKTARTVMEDHGGYFPRQYEALIKLKGIGEYTAAAISSFSSNEARAVVDGNVFRLLSRYFGKDEPIDTAPGKKAFTLLANELIDKNRAGLSNQAMMEFGALMCRPAQPDCPRCPLNEGCFALRNGKVAQLPVKKGKARQRNRHFHYLIIEHQGRILTKKRGPKDIWENLYEFPLIETAEAASIKTIESLPEFREYFDNDCSLVEICGPVKHVLSHQKLFASFYLLKMPDMLKHIPQGWSWADAETLDKLPKPQLIINFLNRFPMLMRRDQPS